VGEENFTVDTHLFRELGEFLVGRDSTALVELIKNAYDADAVQIYVHAEDLETPSRARIIVRDDGLGMTQDQFRAGFLRIASRVKETGDRRSLRYKRRFTGAKGIGRLAAHKLARHLEIHSVSNDPKSEELIERIEATIDWDKVEKGNTLADIPTDAIFLEGAAPTRTSKPGTTITLSRLRRKWTARDLVKFVTESQATTPPPILVDELPRYVLLEPALFKVPRKESVRGGTRRDPGWTLHLTGDFDVGEAHWRSLAEQATWVLEIDGTQPTVVKYAVAPTRRKTKEQPDLEMFTADHQIKRPDRLAPAFQARILIREGTIGAGQPPAARTFIQHTYGVRVYMEGFRVPPYGEVGDDWLELDRAYAERSRELDALSSLYASAESDGDEGLSLLPNRAYLGAVFLTQADSNSLDMLVNREGFVPDPAFRQLQELVRGGVHLATRVRAAANAEDRRKRRENRAAAESRPQPELSKTATATHRIRNVIDQGTSLLKDAREALASGDATAAAKQVAKLDDLFRDAPSAGQELADEQAMMRVLASLGAQTSGFVHEINGLLGLVAAQEKAIATIRSEVESPKAAAKLGHIAKQLGELRLSLERQASYLTEVVSPDRRRRRSRQALNARFEAASRLLSPAAEKRNIEIRNRIPEELRSTPMFSAEVVAIFTNLLTNAIKAAGHQGTIVATGREASNGVVIVRIENTGKRVALGTSEKWFKPFVSTSTESDPTLGVGMGLGLTITRRILEEYSATIRFTEPSKQYSTAVEIRFGETDEQ
jgi:signal transduction histidine kinase